MITDFVTSKDNLQITYTKHGDGPALLLLHGYSNDKTVWVSTGWVERLQSDFTVITVDLRGCGESGKVREAGAYSLENHLNDIYAVADACGFETFSLWGWSFGATIGLHLAARSQRVRRVVAAGTYFGPIFTEDYVRRNLEEIEVLARAKAEGTLHQLDVLSGRKRFAERTDLEVYKARLKGCLSWPGVQPEEINCPVLVYTGTSDGGVLEKLQQQRGAIKEAGLKLHIFDDLNHYQLISEAKAVFSVVSSFLKDGLL
jgi:pimeloyl-ACP methyl ester carboxylesterase